MKILIVSFAVFVFSVSFSNAQSCLPDSIIFSTQQQIDDFPANYPGCTKISGGVTIRESVSGNIKNLDSLAQITSIGGMLYIHGNSTLTILSGLNNLTSIGGCLFIKSNSSLTSLNGLENIDPSTMHSCNSQFKDLNIIDNPNLSQCTVESICELLSFSGMTIDIHDNKAGCNNKYEIKAECVYCPDGSITFRNQQQIDNFPANYLRCTEISGNVAVYGGTIRNLDSLAQITSIKGDFLITDNNLLTDISLNNLRYIGKTLYVITNLTLANLEFNGIDSIGGSLMVGRNDALASSSLISLTSTGRWAYFWENKKLTNLSLTNLNFVGSGFLVEENNALTSLSLNSLKFVSGDIHLWDNKVLTNLSFDNLDSIGGNLRVNNNFALTSLSGLDGLISIGKRITIMDNTALVSLDGLQNIDPDLIHSECDSYKDLTIVSNPNLSECAVESICELLDISGKTIEIHDNKTGCNTEDEIKAACVQCPGDITLTSQQEIDDYRANYPGCTEISGNLKIEESVSGDIKNLDSLAHITFIGGDFWVHSNDSLVSLVLPSLDSIGKKVWIKNNYALNSLSLNNLTSVGGYLHVDDNYSLTNVDGLSGLTSIGESLGFYNNSALSSLLGLSNLNSIGGHLYIGYNSSLTCLNGLQNINPSTIHSNNSSYQDLNIIDNSNIFECAVENICELLKISGTTTDIRNNKTGCNTEDEIKTACSEPECTVVASPENGATNVKINADILWAAVAGAEGYYLTIGTSSGGTDILNSVDVGNVTTYDSNDFPSDTTIFVTITPYNGVGSAAGCAEEYFKTEKATAIKEFDESNLSNNLVNIYPNPAKNLLFVKPVDKQVVIKSIQVIDVSGKTIIEKSINTSEINVSSLKNGAYFIKVYLQEGFVYKKVVISK